jgi:nicotinate-nucleotide pyrophosphorylase
VQEQSIEHYSSESGVSEKDAEVLQQLTRTFNITFDAIALENLALFLIADYATHTQSTGSVTSEAHGGVKQGRFYQLGADSSLPQGVRSVSSVAVNGTGGTPTYVEGTDYDVDLSRISRSTTISTP